LAVSPNGRLAVASGNGAGLGIPRGFDNFCEGGVKSAPNGCGLGKPSLVGDPNTPAPDEGLDRVDLGRGKVSNVKVVPTSHDPAHPRFNSFSIGVAFSPDSRHLYAVGGANQEVYDFTVNGSTLRSPPRILTLPEFVSKTPVPSQ